MGSESITHMDVGNEVEISTCPCKDQSSLTPLNMTYASAVISYQIGHGVGKGWSPVVRTFAHGVSQGAITAAGGGRFKSGFLGGFVGHAVGGQLRIWMPNTVEGRTITAAVAGGVAAVAGGGKFANGAVSGAFAHLFNSEATAGSATSGEGAAGGAFGKWLGKLGRRIFGPLGALLEADNIVKRNAYLNHYTTDLGKEGIVYDSVIKMSPDGNVYMTPNL
ncbi:MAG: hypothetical protein ABW185_03685 [Sedimenticola sp.]